MGYKYSKLKDKIKIIQVQNKQLPGMLLYHDHPMKSTKYNVAAGLLGVYIITDQSIEHELPSKNE